MADQEYIPASRYFTHVTEYRMVAGKDCKHMVWPNQIAGHLQNKNNGHRVKRRDAKRMQQEIEEGEGYWADLLQFTDELPLRNEIGPAIPELHIHRDGLRCTVQPDDCRYICRSEDSMKTHIGQKHPGNRGRRGARTLAMRDAQIEEPWKQVVCQRFFMH